MGKRDSPGRGRNQRGLPATCNFGRRRCSTCLS
jgi:hypothetical protein